MWQQIWHSFRQKLLQSGVNTQDSSRSMAVFLHQCYCVYVNQNMKSKKDMFQSKKQKKIWKASKFGEFCFIQLRK